MKAVPVVYGGCFRSDGTRWKVPGRRAYSEEFAWKQSVLEVEGGVVVWKAQRDSVSMVGGNEVVRVAIDVGGLSCHADSARDVM